MTIRLASLVVIAAVAAVVMAAPAADARVYWHGGVYVGGWPYWWAPYPYGYPFGWYPGPYYYGYPPVVVEEPPPVYIQMAPSPPQYWYYCMPSQAYYPSVESCAEPWIKVKGASP